MARLAGMPGYPYAVAPHPFGSLTPAEVAERAERLVERVGTLLRGGSGWTHGRRWTKASPLDMATVNVHQAKTHLSRLLDRAQEGEEIVIAKAGRPVARLGPL